MPDGDRRPGAGLQGGQRLARVAAGDPHEVLLRLVGERDRAVEAPVAGERPLQHGADVVVGERLERQHEAARQQRADDGEERVLGGGRDQADDPVLDRAQQGVLLGLGEAVDLVDEQHGAPAGVGELPLGGGDDRAHLLDPGVERGELDELPLGGQRDDVRERGLAGAGRAVEDQRHRLVGLDQPAQRCPRRRAGAAGRRPRRAPAAACGRRAARPGRPGAGPSSSGASNSEVTVAKLPAGYDMPRGAAKHRQRHRRPGQRRGHRPRRDAPLHEGGPALPRGRRGRRARRPRRRGDPDRHRRRLLPRRGRVRAQRGARGERAALVRPGRRPRGDQGRAHAARARLGARRVAGLPPPRVRGLAAPAARRRDRALPVPPARPGDAVGGVDGRRCGALFDDGLVRMVGISNADIAQIDVGPRDRRRRAGERAEPVLAGLPLLGRRAGALRGARAGLAAVEPVRRGVGGRVAGRRRRRRSRRWPRSSASRSTG